MLPTYGVGKDLSVQEWNSYLLQMIQLGLIEVAYEENFHLRPTQAGWKVLKGERKVELAKYTSPIYGDLSSRRSFSPVEKTVDSRTPHEILVEGLKALRAGIAAESSNPLSFPRD